MRVRAAFTPGLLLALAVLNLATAESAMAAAAAKLTGEAVTPTSGTTATSFQFSVHFVGSTTDEALSVSASVAGRTVPMTLSSGTARNGTWTGSSTLPAGSWTVTYRSTTTALTNPSVTMAGEVVVTAPTPAPTPPPGPQPTPRPTSVPATATPGPSSSVSPAASPTPFGTTVTDPSGLPSGSADAPSSEEPTASASRSPAPGEGPPVSRPFNVPLEGVVAIGLLGAVTVAAAMGERRRRQAVDAFRAAEASAEGAPPHGENLDEGWEYDKDDEETVATIDYDAPDEPRDEPPDEPRDPASR